jgi:hypothetical protein
MTTKLMDCNRAAMVIPSDGLRCGESRVLDDVTDWRGRAIMVLAYFVADSPDDLPGGANFPRGPTGLAGLRYQVDGCPACLVTGAGTDDADLRGGSRLTLCQGAKTLAHLFADKHGALRLRSALDGRTFPLMWLADLGPLAEAGRA